MDGATGALVNGKLTYPRSAGRVTASWVTASEPGSEAVDALMVPDKGQSLSGLQPAPPRGGVRPPQAASRAHRVRSAQSRRRHHPVCPHCAGRFHGSVLAQAARGFRAAGRVIPGRLPSHSQLQHGSVSGRDVQPVGAGGLRLSGMCDTVDLFASELGRRAEHYRSRHGEPGSEAVDALLVPDRGQSLSGLRPASPRGGVRPPDSRAHRARHAQAVADAAPCALTAPVPFTAPYWHKLLEASVLPAGPAPDGFPRIHNPRAALCLAGTCKPKE